MTASVSRLPLASSRECPVCGSRAQWQVGPSDRSCDRCLAAVLRSVVVSSDGFAPPLVSALGGAS